MAIQVLSANLGSGGPQARPSLETLAPWVAGLAGSGVQVLFLQEMPPSPEWSGCLGAAGYRLYEGGPPMYRCRSGIAVHESLGEMKPIELESTAYHGSYVAAAEVPLGAHQRVTCVSVHASPTILGPVDLERWRWKLPRPRRGTTGEPPLWDSDFVLATLAALRRDRDSILVAGDLNEARLWDQDRGGHWGQDWFAFAEDVGLHDLTFRSWGEERPTHGRFQDDHLLATADLLAAMSDVRIGPSSGSDHESLLLSLELSE